VSPYEATVIFYDEARNPSASSGFDLRNTMTAKLVWQEDRRVIKDMCTNVLPAGVT
jgi:hypothetical protein